MNEKKVLFEDEFTGKYELAKTLRFVLRPIGNTQKMLEDNHVFEMDKNLQIKYQAIKPFFDRLHQEFVEESLAEFSLTSLNTYHECLIAYTKNKKDKALENALKKEEARLRLEIVNQFDETAKKWSDERDYLKKNTTDIFFEAGIFQLLKEKYGHDANALVIDETDEKKERKISIFDQWGKFTGYFDKFHATRKNFYKEDGTSTALATRMIDQNLRRFAGNKLIFEKNIASVIDCSELEGNFRIVCSEIFSLNGYSKCLTQRGIDIYNKVLGGESFVTGEKQQGVNELINEYRQKNPDKKLPFLTLLDKQILSERSKSFVIGIPDAQHLLQVLKEYSNVAQNKVNILHGIVEKLPQKNSEYDFQKVYLSKEALNTVLHRWVSQQDDMERVLFGVVKKYKADYELLRNGRKDSSKIEEKNGEFSFPDFIKLSHIQEALQLFSSNDVVWKSKYYQSSENNSLIAHINTADNDIFSQFLSIFSNEFQEILVKYESALPKLQSVVQCESLTDEEIDQNFKATIKDFFDAVKYLYQMGKYFAVEKKQTWLENYDLCDIFYKESDSGYSAFYQDAFSQLVRPYDDVRNYLTKKPYSDEKWKLNFENATLADGWDKNKETENTTIILKKLNRYYIAIMKKGCATIFSDASLSNSGENVRVGSYQKMVYKFFPEASKMIPKCSTQKKEVIKHFATSNADFQLFVKKDFASTVFVSKRVYELNNQYFYKENITQYFIPKSDKEKTNGVKMFQKGFVTNGGDAALFQSALFDWIEFCKQFLKAYKSTSIFDYSQLKESSEYHSLDEFYNDINKLTYSVTFTPISEQYINEKNQAGELYLFEIHNKDWNTKDGQIKTGSKNTHTLYFESLFSDENKAKGSMFKINGQAELFFRPATSKEKLGTKEDNNKNIVIDHKRYSKNTILFHLPITMNRGKKKITPFSFNEQTKEFLKQNKSINVIGVDRGEKHLAYYSVVNQQGDILEIGSLNNPLDIPYQELLEKRAKGREDARKDWSDVEKIKDLKKGYISQVVRKIADMIIQYNAIVVFEDLNMRFKQVRGGIEKSVYQQLEKALIDKLGFLIDKKEIDPKKAGHLLQAYQLTAPFETFKDMGKQTGIIFYTQAEYTSTTDPLTGFRKNIYVINSAKIGKILDMIAKFDAIGWDEEKKSYYFTYNPIQFVEKKFSEKTLDKEWTLYANVPRVAGQKNSAGKWESKPLNPNEMLQKLFEGWGLIERGNHLQDVKKTLLENKDRLQSEARDVLGNDKKRNFFSDFMYIFNLILQIRNSFSKKQVIDKDGAVRYEGEDIDFIASPVWPLFTTASSKSVANFSEFESKFIGNENDKKKFLAEFNGDANGAYNIARKGIMILERLNDEAALKKDGLYIHKHQWDAFVSSKNIVL